ncbi:hypothetical protein CLOSTMETH_01127 [[Clostridium] methylpentosum DSM 5476]|uniref:Uncharacterized protein n=1 Tax=[Clostridium] methylpentosum DSM 5476 TaxID=537013 RepID=C0EBA9_9FIRM|nr:hypothetical protein CLOSTMETH_01127 [[Clostridium] methylpentosum DSM 5476]
MISDGIFFCILLFQPAGSSPLSVFFLHSKARGLIFMAKMQINNRLSCRWFTSNVSYSLPVA